MSVRTVAKLLFKKQKTGALPRHVNQELLKRRGRGETRHLNPLWKRYWILLTKLKGFRNRGSGYNRREHFLLKHHPAIKWNLAEIQYDANWPVCRLTSVLAVHCCYCQLWSLVWPMSLNKRARKAAVTVNLPFNSIVQIKLTQLYSTSSPPSSFDSPDTRHWWTGHGK